MDHRRLKVGDIVDDYCPRERRITDHAIVAMIDETIRQTRCTACDSEHPYKEARTPRARKRTTPAALYDEVLTDAAAQHEPVPPPAPAPAPPVTAAEKPVVTDTLRATDPVEPASPVVPDEGPVHRPLIRATLPRPEGPASQRPIPEFTVRQANGRRFREGEFRGFRGAQPSGRNGSQPHGSRSARHGSSLSQQRPRHGRPSPHGKKRSR